MIIAPSHNLPVKRQYFSCFEKEYSLAISAIPSLWMEFQILAPENPRLHWPRLVIKQGRFTLTSLIIMKFVVHLAPGLKYH